MHFNEINGDDTSENNSNNDNDQSGNGAAATAATDEEEATGAGRRFCKICYLTDEEESSQSGGTEPVEDDEWMHPCKCSGTIKWVHRRCLQIWLEQAPFAQRNECTMCKYRYQSSWRLKPVTRWCCPDFKLGIRDGLEISVDALCTYYLMKRVAQLVQGTAKSLWRSYFWVAMWRVFVMNNRRIAFYRQLGVRALGAVLETSVQNGPE